MIFTKAEIMYDFAKDVVRQYTIYAIVRENFESKDFNQSMWEIWDSINILYSAQLDERRQKEMIRALSREIVDKYWQYIDTLLQGIQENCRGQQEREAVNSCREKIENMKRMEIVDVAALKEIRQLEELIY